MDDHIVSGHEPTTAPGSPTPEAPSTLVVGFESSSEGLNSEELAFKADHGDDLYRAFGPTRREQSRDEMGRYEWKRSLGAGGQAQVDLFYDHLSNRMVALKIIETGASTRDRVLNEGKILAGLEHPNVVKLYYIGDMGEKFGLWMKFYEHGSLDRWLKACTPDRELPWQWAAKLVACMADGMHHAHVKGVIHRDLKPANILLELEGGVAAATDQWPPRFIPVVSDFGLARELDRPEAFQTATGAILGTPGYLSPEQAKPRSSGATQPNYTPRTDVYALGVILFELLTRTRPFRADTLPDLVVKIVNDPPPPPRALRPRIPRDLETICLRCLEKDPTHRYATARALADDLRGCLKGDSISGRRSIDLRRILKQAGKRRVQGTVAAALIAMASFAAWSTATVRDWKQARLLSQLKTANAAGLSSIVGELDLGVGWVADRLREMFCYEPGAASDGAALALARREPFHLEQAIARSIEPGDKPFTPEGTDPDWARVRAYAATLIREVRDKPVIEAFLQRVTDTPTAPGNSEATVERDDRRRANASAVLAMVHASSAPDGGIKLPNERQARAFAVHAFGPIGVKPETLLAAIEHSANASDANSEAERAQRRTLWLALGEVPEAAWTSGTAEDARLAALRAYEFEPDRGIHGAVKWFLRCGAVGNEGSWRAVALTEQSAIDAELSGKPPADPRRGWRIGPLGITLIRVEISAVDGQPAHLIELADTEMTVRQVCALLPGYQPNSQYSPSMDCPANEVNWFEAARACNAVSALVPVARCYWERAPRGPDDVHTIGVQNEHQLQSGFRLPTTYELYVACAAGSADRRFFGNSDALLPHFVWHRNNARKFQPVGTRKPNDLGFFDTMGNVTEWLELPGAPLSVSFQCSAGASITALPPAFDLDSIRSAKADRGVTDRGFSIGFRIARTVEGQ